MTVVHHPINDANPGFSIPAEVFVGVLAFLAGVAVGALLYWLWDRMLYEIVDD